MQNETALKLETHNSVDELRAILSRQQSSFLQKGAPSALQRIARLQKLYDLVQENQQDLIAACHQDFGNRSLHQTQTTEVLAVMMVIKDTTKQLKRWMRDEKRKATFPQGLIGAKAFVHYQPKGVIGNISTWNFPVHLSLLPLAGIFAAGNNAMVKLSEMTPQTSALLQRLFAQYFDETECVGICGGPDIGAAFAALPFDHLIFTGATSIGRHVLKAAAENLTPVTLELGGKSPVIVSRACDTAKAAEKIMAGKALNMGQVCLAPDYCFVPQEALSGFVEAAQSSFARMFPTIYSNPDYTAVINKRHFQRLQEMITDAKVKGAEVIQINPANETEEQRLAGQYKLPMTLVINPSDDCQLMQDEIFGPIMAIKTYHTVAEAMAYINARARPLALYYFGESKDEQNTVLHNTISGGVCINDVIVHTSNEDLPFGGIGDSGMGSYHGFDGFKTFSHHKAVFKQSKLDILALAGLVPPYSDRAQKLLNLMTKNKP